MFFLEKIVFNIEICLHWEVCVNNPKSFYYAKRNKLCSSRCELTRKLTLLHWSLI